MPQFRSVFRSAVALSLVVTLFAAFAGTGTAQPMVNPSVYPDFFTQGVNECYLASVSNGENFGLGTSRTSVTVQNLSEELGVVYLLVGDVGGFAEGQFALLQAGASKTFTAAELGVPNGKTAAVAVLGYDMASSQAGVFTPEDGIAIGCLAKQAVAGANLPHTSSVDHAVSGYNATSGREVGFFQALYLPIIQTNCGPGGCWNTILRVANVGPFDNAGVTVRFFPADDGSGSLNTGFQLQALVGQGQTWSIDISEHVPQGWVGSAHILTDDSVVAIADRYKAGTNMWITNTASNQVAERRFQLPDGPSNMPYVLYAPDVRLDYNGWNTGISVANTVNADNTVNIQYFGSDGNAPQAQTQRLSAHGMTYFYNPSSPAEDSCTQPVNQVVTCDFVGGAIVLSQAPVAVAVDGVKYAGNDPNVGQAFSYSATGNVYQVQAMPLIQKGLPATGMGATSGITFLNPNATGTYVTARWINPSGFNASNMGGSVVWVPGYATGFIYTMTQANLPTGFIGSAWVSSQQPLAATSANVDYAVTGDGTAIWNLYNPCGLYRAIGDCTFKPEPAPLATKNFSVRPLAADAWVCVYDAISGQDDKPTAPTTDCLPQQIFDKGAGEGGQGKARTFVARDWFRGLQPQDGEPLVLSPVAAPWFSPLRLDVNYDTNTVTYSAVPEASFIAVGYWKAVDGVSANMACTDLMHIDFETEQDKVGQFLVNPSQVTGAALAVAGDLNNAIVVVQTIVDTSITAYCAQLEEGTLRPETPSEMQERLKTIVPPFQVDTAGLASVDLPAGCYFFVVSAAGYDTDRSDRECLTAGGTLTNTVDLAPTVAQPASLTKWFCWTEDADNMTGDPLIDSCAGEQLYTNLEVWLVAALDRDTRIDLTLITTGENAGSFFTDQITDGIYQLCWLNPDGDSSAFNPNGFTECEPVEVNGSIVLNNMRLDDGIPVGG